MRISPRQLNRATLARQMLLARERRPVVDAIRRLLALQAQAPSSPYLALWARLDDLDPSDLDAAFRSFEVVKATLMRVTLHAVAADDRPILRSALRPTLRAAALNDRRFHATGLSSDDADALVRAVVAFAGRPRTRTEIEGLVAERLGAPPEPGVWRALRMIAPLVHAPADHPWSFARPARFVAPPGPSDPVDQEGAMQRLIVRYLAAFGPASRRDVAQFTMLRQGDTRCAWEGLADQLVTMEGPAGETLYDVPDGLRPDEDVPAPPRLLPMWDSVLLAYADRSRVLPEPYRAHLIRRNGDVLPALLVDGAVAGVWRPGADGIEVAAFQALGDTTWEEIAREGRALRSFLAARGDRGLGRFERWWSALPAQQIVQVA